MQSLKHCVILLSFLFSTALHAQLTNPELMDLDTTGMILGWDIIGNTGFDIYPINHGWEFLETPFVHPSSSLFPEWKAGDKIWLTFENTVGDFGGIQQVAEGLEIGHTYCLSFNATVNRIFVPTASLAVRLDIDDIAADEHTFILGRPKENISLCFTATQEEHLLSIRTELKSGLTTFLMIEEGSGLFTDITMTTNTTEYLITQKITVSPNPATNIIQVEGLDTGSSMLIITDSSGKEVMRSSVSDLDKIDIRSLEAGLYLLSFFQKESPQTVKLIKY